MENLSNLKNRVKTFWENETCGTRYGDDLERVRYSLEPHISAFADFKNASGKKVLEIGIGAGVDFENWVKHGALATGIDLTEAAVKVTRHRLEQNKVASNRFQLIVSDAENLPFDDNEFDILYSWGVLHHTANPTQALEESLRVLKPSGILKIMLYHSMSWTGFLLWLQHCFFKLRPHRSLKYAMYHHLESPGTKSYTMQEAKNLLTEIGFSDIEISAKLCAGDLLQIKPSKKYQGALYRLIWKFYPRWLVKLLGDRFGLELLIKARKPPSSTLFPPPSFNI